LKQRDHFGDLCIYGQKMLKWIFKRMGYQCVNLIQLPAGSMLVKEIFNELRSWSLLSEVSGP